MKGFDQKQRIFHLKRILERDTDENHGITMKHIQQALCEAMGLPEECTPDRKAIGDDMKHLRDDGILDLSKPMGQNKEYFVLSRDIDISDLKIIADCVAASKFLTEKKADQIINSLNVLCSKYQIEELRRKVHVGNRIRSMNSTVHININNVQQAINNNCKIQFKYYDFGPKHEKQYKLGGTLYTVSPWTMLYTGDAYYALAYDETEKSRKKGIKTFRLDRMEGVKLLLEERVGKEDFEKENMDKYLLYTFNMYHGEQRNVTLVFQNYLSGVIWERFGRDVVVTRYDDRHSKVIVPVAVSPQFFGWVFGLNNGVRIAGPEDVQKEYQEMLANAAKKYE